MLQCLSLAAHVVITHFSRDVDAALADIEVQRRFVPVQNRKIELVAASSQAQLEDTKTKETNKETYADSILTCLN